MNKYQNNLLNECASRTPIKYENPIDEFLGAIALIALLLLCLFV